MHHCPLLLQEVAYNVIAFSHNTAQGVLALVGREYRDMRGMWNYHCCRHMENIHVTLIQERDCHYCNQFEN